MTLRMMLLNKEEGGAGAPPSGIVAEVVV